MSERLLKGRCGKGRFTHSRKHGQVYVYVDDAAGSVAKTINIEGTRVNVDLDKAGNVVGVEVY